MRAECVRPRAQQAPNSPMRRTRTTASGSRTISVRACARRRQAGNTLSHDRRSLRHRRGQGPGVKIAEAAWGCADPGLQYDSTINRWHTCPNSGRINASNPCSEYMFLDDTACNLSSVNLTKFLREDGTFDIDAYRHTCRIFHRAGDPRRPLQLSDGEHRPKQPRLPAPRARLRKPRQPAHVARRPVRQPRRARDGGDAHGHHVRASVQNERGDGRVEIAFAGFAKNREPMLRVMRMHRDAAYDIDRDAVPGELYRAACWQEHKSIRLASWGNGDQRGGAALGIRRRAGQRVACRYVDQHPGRRDRQLCSPTGQLDQERRHGGRRFLRGAGRRTPRLCRVRQRKLELWLPASEQQPGQRNSGRNRSTESRDRRRYRRLQPRLRR